ncbi:MAG: carbohydrate kinase, partial [Akkermansiaceae bacterium]
GSATMGAGMRAAQGLGDELGNLESKFSQPKEGRTIQPNSDAHEVYNANLPKFKAFLAKQCAS